MKSLNIKVIPNAKKNKVVEETSQLKIYVSAPAVEGKANKAAIEVLAGHFNIKKKEIKIIGGEKAREKTIEINI